MNLTEVKNTPKEQRKTIMLNVRVTPHVVAWLKEKQISVTKIVMVALKELGYLKPKEK